MLLLLAAWTLWVVYFSPDRLVSFVGIHNTYLIAFIYAAIGGITTLTGYSFVALLVTFVAGGADPLVLGLSGGLGVFISDCIFYYIARYGVRSYARETEWLTSWIVRKTERWRTSTILLGIFVYTGFIPLPNDPLMIALALHGIQFRSFAPVLFLGSITGVTITAYLGQQLFSL